MELYLVRHGESEGNAARILQGHLDYPLTKIGKMQAKALSLRLESVVLDAVYSSDLARAAETAKILTGKRSVPPIVSPLWREGSFGKWEGLSYEQIHERDKGFWESFYQNPTSITPPDGESMASVQERAKKGLAEILQSHRGGTIAIVAHAGSLRSLTCHLLELPLRNIWQLRIDNCSLTVFTLDHDVSRSKKSRRPILSCFNDTRHLDKIKTVPFGPI